MTTEVKNAQDVASMVQAAVDRHGATLEALVPIVSEINRKLGYLPREALVEVSRLLHMPDSQLFAVASFYRMLSTQPRGKHVIQFCESAPCHVMGGREVWQALQVALELEPGETSTDGKWTLLTVSCPGLCGVAPVMVIDEDVYGNVVPERVPEILARYECTGFAPAQARVEPFGLNLRTGRGKALGPRRSGRSGDKARKGGQ